MLGVSAAAQEAVQNPVAVTQNMQTTGGLLSSQSATAPGQTNSSAAGVAASEPQQSNAGVTAPGQTATTATTPTGTPQAGAVGATGATGASGPQGAQVETKEGGSPQLTTGHFGWPSLPDHKTLTVNEWVSQAGYDLGSNQTHTWRGGVELQDYEIFVKADEADWDEETHTLKARGNVYYHDYEKNQQIWCDEMEYNTETRHGYFYDVRGETMPKAVVRKGVLSGNSPFHFEGLWAERIGSRYLVHEGWVTDCKMPDPWWRLKGKKFDIIPEDRAIAYHSTYFLRKVPIFFFPLPFYRPLKKSQRKSGLLLPNLVPRSQRGFMVGLGYYWAINESYDITYRFQDFNTNALKHNVDVRGKPTARTDFNFILYGVNDLGGDPRTGDAKTGENRQKYSGLNIYFTGRADLGDGWTAAGQVNYVSSFRFRQEWSESFNEAIGSEMHSDAFLNKDFDTYTFDLVASRNENFQSTEIQETNANGSFSYQRNAVILHKLPEAQFSSRDHSIWKNLPVWFSFESSAGFLYRLSPVFQNNVLVNSFETDQFTTRLRFAPHVSTSMHWLGINFTPSLGLDETFYGESQNITESPAASSPFYHAANSDIVRSARDFSLDIAFPSIERVFNKKTFLGDKLKHVIEPRVTYRYVTGIGDDFDRIIRFDENDLLANTNELSLSLTNRLYAKRGQDVVEVLTWELIQKRYFDPTFGGAALPGQRNVFDATADVTAYSFVAGPRTYSPVASILRANPVGGATVTWLADYDPMYHRIVDSTVEVGYRWKGKYYFNAGDNLIRSIPVLTPNADQWRFTVGFGDPQHRGWNAATSVAYDVKVGYLQYMTTQVTYNTDCCGLSAEYRRLNAGVRDETQFYISFAIANVGAFGTLKKQDRLF
jgi:LPS-assembly protein